MGDYAHALIICNGVPKLTADKVFRVLSDKVACIRGARRVWAGHKNVISCLIKEYHTDFSESVREIQTWLKSYLPDDYKKVTITIMHDTGSVCYTTCANVNEVS